MLENLSNEFVTLEKLTPENLNELEALFNPKIWHWYTKDIKSFSDLISMYSPHFKSMEQGKSFAYLIRSKESNEAIGSSRFIDLDFSNRTVEIGSTWYGLEWQRTYANTATKLLMLESVFETLEFNRVSLMTDSRNEQSYKAMERLGAKFEGTIRNHRICDDGYLRSSVLYSILKDEWPSVKKFLAERLIR